MATQAPVAPAPGERILQQLTLYLKGGQNIVVTFKAERADVLNPQIDAFLKAFGDKNKKFDNFIFQGSRIVAVLLDDVSAADIVSLIAKDKEPGSAPN